jgi:hypothetical protein
VTVSPFCDDCTAADRWANGERLAAEVLSDGRTRLAAIEAYRAARAMA